MNYDSKSVSGNNNNNINIINDYNNNIDRAHANTSDSFSDPTRTEKANSAIIETRIDANINIYRYKFTDVFTSELYIFSKVHQYDNRSDFKEAWEDWLENNENIVSNEVMRLTKLGYEGDILDKMFKSARYYFRKKSTEKKAPIKRRTYMGVQKETINAIDEHIRSAMSNVNFKPSDGFDEFCKSNIEILKEEVQLLCQSGFTNSEEIKNKIKKTYKNRYFLVISK